MSISDTSEAENAFRKLREALDAYRGCVGEDQLRGALVAQFDAGQLCAELRRRGLAVSVWGPEDIVSLMEAAIEDLPAELPDGKRLMTDDEQVALAAELLSVNAKCLEDSLGRAGNDALGTWISLGDLRNRLVVDAEPGPAGAPALSGGTDVAPSVAAAEAVEGFLRDVQRLLDCNPRIRAENVGASALVQLPDSLWDLVDEMKGTLGAAVANLYQDPGRQDEAISCVENLVAERFSNTVPVEDYVAAAVLLWGAADAGDKLGVDNLPWIAIGRPEAPSVPAIPRRFGMHEVRDVLNGALEIADWVSDNDRERFMLTPGRQIVRITGLAQDHAYVYEACDPKIMEMLDCMADAQSMSRVWSQDQIETWRTNGQSFAI